MFGILNEEVNVNVDFGALQEGVTYEEGSAGVYQVLAEAAEDWMNLQQSAMLSESKYMLNEDVTLLQEGIKDTMKNVVQWFRDLGAKIANVFKKFITMIDEALDFDKKWIEKKKKSGIFDAAPLNGDTKVSAKNWAKASGFQSFDTDRLADEISVLANGKTFNAGDKGADFWRGLLIGKDNASGEEFTASIKSMFFEGEEKTEEITVAQIYAAREKFIGAIESTRTMTKAANKAKDTTLKAIKNAIKVVNALQKQVEGSHESADIARKNYGAIVTSLKTGCTTATTGFNMCLNLIKERRNDVKTILNTLVGAYGKKKADKDSKKEDEEDK